MLLHELSFCTPKWMAAPQSVMNLTSPTDAPSAAGWPPPPPQPHPSQRFSSPRLPLVAAIAIAICDYIELPIDRFAVSSLSRLPTVQAAALLQLLKGSVDPVRSVSALDFLFHHLPRRRFEAAYTVNAMNYPHSVEILQWWKASGLELRYSKWAMQSAGRVGNLQLLQWWKDSGLPLKYEALALSIASDRGHVAVLQWWKDSGLALKVDRRALTAASRRGHLAVLDWWKDSGFLPKSASADAVDAAVRARQLASLDWWLRCGLDVDCWDPDPFVRCTDIDVLDWWKESGMFARWTKSKPNLEEEVFCYAYPETVRKWWQRALREAGLEL